MLGESYAVSDTYTYPRTVIAHMKGIRFRRVRFTSLKAGLTNSLEVVSPSLEPTLPELSRDAQSSGQKFSRLLPRLVRSI